MFIEPFSSPKAVIVLFSLHLNYSLLITKYACDTQGKDDKHFIGKDKIMTNFVEQVRMEKNYVYFLSACTSMQVVEVKIP